jgi:hypothetical protein
VVNPFELRVFVCDFECCHSRATGQSLSPNGGVSTVFLIFFPSFFSQVIHNVASVVPSSLVETRSHRGQPHEKSG